MATFYTKLELAILSEILHEVGDAMIQYGFEGPGYMNPLEKEAMDRTMKGIQSWHKQFRPVFWKSMQNPYDTEFLSQVWKGKDALLGKVRKGEDNHSMDLYE